MGFRSLLPLLIILLIVILLFGAKRLRTIGEDLGAAIKSFRKGLDGEENKDQQNPPKL